MAQVDCGIDIGSTNLKVVLVNEEGRVIHTRSVPSPRVSDGAGPVTDATALVALLEQLIVEGWRSCCHGRQLRSIAVAGVGEDGLGVRADLTPAGPAIPWFDRRAEPEATTLNRQADCTDRTGIEIGFDRTAAKWLWLHNNRPAELAEAKLWIALTDYPAVWWSGTPFMSASLAPRTACFDVKKREWVNELIAITHAPPLPEVIGAGRAVGGVRRGLLRDSGAADAGTIVAAGGHDHPVAASVIRRFDPAGLVDSLGTANLLYGEADAVSELQRLPGLAYSLPPAAGRGIACLGVLEFALALSQAEASGDELQAFLRHERLPGSPGSDTRIRRALEIESLKARHILDMMTRAGVPGGEIYTSGGWSRSRGLVELRASVFGRPLNVIDDMEVTALGAALFGAEAATGKAASPLRHGDIVRVDPVAGWIQQYDRLYTAFAGQGRS